MKDLYTRQEVIELVSKATAYQHGWTSTHKEKLNDERCHEIALNITKLRWADRLDVAKRIIEYVENI
jgi:hypothetical protein